MYIFISIIVCFCMNDVHTGACAMKHVWKSECIFVELALSSLVIMNSIQGLNLGP